MRACRWIVATALHLFATAALAPPVTAESERIHIQFEAPKGCSDEASFLRALKKRTRRFEIFADSQPTRWFVVTIHRTAAAVSGQLEVRAPGTEASVRNVAGKTCDEVAAVLALMTALAVDPNTQNASSPSRAEAPVQSPPIAASPGAGESPNATPSAPATAMAPEPVMPRVLPTPPPVATQDRKVPTPTVTTRASDAPGSNCPQPLRWSAGFQVSASERVSPTRAWGGALFVETALTGASASPVFRGGLFFSQTRVELPSGAGAKIQWFLGFLEGCPTRLTGAAGHLALYPCLAANVGVLRGQGQNLDENETTADVWADLGPVLRARVALLRGFSVEAQGTIVFPLRRLSFDVEDAGPGSASSTVFSTPSWGVRAGIGVAYEFR